jgi:hypothetical protein
MVMMDRAKHLSEPLRWTRAGRVAVIASATLLLAAVIVLAVLALTRAPSERPGCITLTFASTVGGASIHYCGADARARCAAPHTLPVSPSTLAEACRKAGYPFGA